MDKIYFIQSEKRLECIISKLVSLVLKPVNRFGSSDCRCRGHLYLFPEDLLTRVEDLLINKHRFKSFSNRDFIQRMGKKMPGIKLDARCDFLAGKGNNIIVK